jgi:NAD(P)-dependent dehydrogenase (short-subunit alcohol dehydrogenase family)
MGRLQDKVAVITGGTSGIGARTAQLFVAEGAKVVIAGRREDEGQTLAAGLGAAASFIRTDVTSEAEIRSMIEHALERFGRIDCLFNNAGGPSRTGGVAEVDIAEFDAAIAVHVRGALLGMKYAAPGMLRQGSGSIINMASINGRRAGFTTLGYSTAKAAVIHLSRCAAVELGQHGVRVNSLSPGPVLTGIFGKAAGRDHREADRRAETMKAALDRLLPSVQPIPRVGMPDDIARAALYLASDDSSLVNGHDLVVDGGITAGRPASVMRGERAVFAEVLGAGGPQRSAVAPSNTSDPREDR